MGSVLDSGSHRLLFMGEHTPGSRLRELRGHLKLSLRQAASRAETITHNTIRSLEVRVGGWDRVEIGTLVALSRAYELPLDRLVHFVFMGDNATDLAEEYMKGPEALEVHPDWVAFPVFGMVDAGDLGAATPREGLVAYIPKEHLTRRGALRENVRVFHVNGSCMVSDEARRVEKNFAHGDYVAIDTQRPPQLGDVVVAWHDELGIMVIKRWQVDGERVLLHPLSSTRPPIVVEEADNVRLLGPVIWRGG